MKAISEVSAQYELSGNASIYTVNIAPTPLAAVQQALTLLTQAVRDGQDDLDPLREQITYFCFRVATNVLPPKHEMLGVRELFDGIRAKSAMVPPDSKIGRVMEQALPEIEAFLDLEMSPVCKEVLDLIELESEDRRAIALRATRNVVPTKEYLDRLGCPAAVESRTSLRSMPLTGTLVVVGRPSFFTDATWNAPKAESTCFVQYLFGGSGSRSGGLFDEAGGLTTPKFRSSGVSQSGSEILTKFDPDEFWTTVAQNEMHRQRESGEDSVEACLLLLSGGHSLWTAADEGAWLWGLDISDLKNPSISRIDARNVSSGTYVLVRDQGAESEIVRQIADEEFGAAQFRATQQRWKEALRAGVDQYGGITALRSAILRRGAKSANPAGWLSESAIRPNQFVDFQAACAAVGLSADCEFIWTELTRIRGCHQSAGHKIREELEEALLREDLRVLEMEGELHLSATSLGTLSVHQVEFRHDRTQHVSRQILDRKLPVEDGAWPE